MGSPEETTVIERVLEEQGRTLRWLALSNGFDPAHAWRMVHGARPLSDDFKAAAAKALGVPEDILFPPAIAEAAS